MSSLVSNRDPTWGAIGGMLWTVSRWSQILA